MTEREKSAVKFIVGALRRNGGNYKAILNLAEKELDALAEADYDRLIDAENNQRGRNADSSPEDM